MVGVIMIYNFQKQCNNKNEKSGGRKFWVLSRKKAFCG